MSESAPVKPLVLLLSLEVNSSFGLFYQRLLGKLNTVATLIHAKHKMWLTLKDFADHPPHAILVTDGSIAHHHDAYAILRDYARGGGTLVFMGNFSGTIPPEDINNVFHKADLPWTCSEYLRTTVHRNDTEGTSSHASLLPASYSQEAVFLANVPVQDAWYLPNGESRTESSVFPSERIRNLEQTPIAFTKIGSGRIGYVGDVNGEEGSDAVVLAMCGLRHVV